MADFSRTFLDFIARRELRVPREAKTGKIVNYTARPEGEVEWVRASGAATLYSFVVYHRQYSPEFPVPYNVALVELAEGPRLISTVVGAEPQIGMVLTACFDDAGKLVFKRNA
jgi:hypothetical protein